MKWYVVICLVTARIIGGNVLRCSSDDPSSITENQDRVTPLKKADLPSGKDCAPGTSWKTECNSCVCGSDGKASCKVQSCPDGKLFGPLLRCAPSSVWKNECNMCLCSPDGQPVCTKMDCLQSSDILDPVNFEPATPEHIPDNKETVDVATSSKNKTVICEANRSFKKDCNTCWCNEDGTSFFCTRRACVPQLPDDEEDDKPEDLRIIKKECRPNEVFELDCNMCRCNPDGKSFSCTRRACLEQVDDFKINMSTTLSRKARASQEPQKTCQPGTEFRMDCNKCLCDNEGQDFSCTRIDCNALNNNNNGGIRNKRDAAERVPAEGCTPGSVFERGCNVCRCTEVGYALCTTNKCQEKDATDKPTTEVPGPAVDANFRCNPGEQYNFDCNDCTCSADGKSIFCTLRFCDKSLTPD